MSDRRRADDVERLLDHTLDDFIHGPRGVIQLAAGWSIAIDDALNAAENVFKKNGVRASPTAP